MNKFLFYVEFLNTNREWCRWNAAYEDPWSALEALRERQKFDDSFERRVVSEVAKGMKWRS